jgi:hypothetical protein
LLTDGAVLNTYDVIGLIKSKASLGTRVHTFGVGSGADERLIKGSAQAGFGHYYFVYKEEEIEEKVINSLTKTHLEYQVLTNLELFND